MWFYFFPRMHLCYILSLSLSLIINSLYQRRISSESRQHLGTIANNAAGGCSVPVLRVIENSGGKIWHIGSTNDSPVRGPLRARRIEHMNNPRALAVQLRSVLRTDDGSRVESRSPGLEIEIERQVSP